MYIKWNIEKVNNFVEENSNCKLLSKEYETVDSKMKFLCECGNEFETTFYKFRSRNKRQCNSCGRLILSEKQKLTYEEVKKFIEEDSQSGCKLLSKEYKTAHQKLNIQCSCGKTYKTKWNHFKNSNQRQCPDCGTELRTQARRLPIEEVLGYINSKGCELLSPYENLSSKIKIKCNCGQVYETSYGLFRDLGYDKCKHCREENKVISHGETKIRNWLVDKNIKFKEEVTFDDLKLSNSLRFDFGILNSQNKIKLIIEYDGKQHFGIGNFTDNTEEMIMQYQSTIQNDSMKNEYCFNNGIPLLRIPYNKYKYIEEILETALS